MKVNKNFQMELKKFALPEFQIPERFGNPRRIFWNEKEFRKNFNPGKKGKSLPFLKGNWP